MLRDVRICFLGDSFVVGVGDPACLGWVGAIAARTSEVLGGMAVYNLGVRRDTSADVRARWSREAAIRLAADVESRLVLSFGVNDCADKAGRVRVPADRSKENLQSILKKAQARFPVFVVGPPLIADAAQNERIAALDRVFSEVCLDMNLPSASVYDDLSRTAAWGKEIASGDGSHPGAQGYQALADLVRNKGWGGWLRLVESVPD